MLNKYLRVSFKLALSTSIALLGACASLTPMEQQALLSTTPASQQIQFEPLPVGMQGDPNLEDGVIEVAGKKSFYKGYQLPVGHGSFVVQLRTYIDNTPQGDGFFYPVIELYDFDMRQIDVMRPQLRFTQFSSKGRYAALPIRLNPDVGFFVIRTEPKLFGQEASYTTAHEGASWSYSVTPFNKRKAAMYLPLGQLELLTPDEGFAQPFEKMSGAFWQFSFDRGGEELAVAEDYLPNLTLGGGPIFSLGYAFSVPSRPFSSIRASAGYSYLSVSDKDGSSHKQSFMTGDLLWVESNQVSSLGIGVTYRGAHEYTTGGVTTEFDPVWGPKIAAEIRGAMGVSLGAQLSWLSFTDETGEKRSSNQAGIYLIKLY
ncbi:MAG: hypothetical protein HWE18_08750 [Gammaproteobacteria bacterium]|nr:hypothetical protein [Gammaproteobacteria bacterium]